MLQKNEYFQAECLDYTYDGMGIVKKDGFPYFVKGMLVGEKGSLKVIKNAKNYGVARLMTLDEPSSQRVEPACPYNKLCGGCHIQHFSSREQQRFKTKYVMDCLTRIAGVDDVEVLPCHMMDVSWHYRHKVQLPCGYEDGHFVTGFYRRHTNDIVAHDTCMIQTEQANRLAKRVKELLDQWQVTAYDKKTHRGCMRHLLIKTGYHTKNLMLVFITNGRLFSHSKEIVTCLTEEFADLKTVIQNINERHDNVILGEEEIILYGPGYIMDRLDDIQFQISAKSFYQVNPSQAEVLYRYALDFASLTGKETVVDAYCGIGTISLFLARHAKKVYGVEIVPEAIADAKKNAQLNQIDNVVFAVADAQDFMCSLQEKIDVVVCDPPRKGCSQTFLDAVVRLEPKRFVYVSCNVATQARDISYLKTKGYYLERIQPVDMFPQTYGVETVALLSKKENVG